MSLRPSYRLSRQRTKLQRRSALFEKLEERRLLKSDWQNALRPADVNNDLVTAPLDALLVINRINQNDRVLAGPRKALEPLFDTSGDGIVSPLDALLVINVINDESTARAVGRIDGETASAPVGFISIPITQLPGSTGQIVPLSTTLNIGREEFNELGIFVADDATGRVGGIAPGEPGYADAAFNSSQRRVLYSRFNSLRTANTADLPAGSFAHVYVLQSASDNSDPEEHLRARQVSTNLMRVGWEEHVSPSGGWIQVGDRGYDDATVDFQIGEPIDGNAEPILRAIPNQSLNELTLLSLDAFAMDSDMPGDVIRYSFDLAPTGAVIDPATGSMRWTPSEAQGPGNFEFVVRATDAAGAFDTESFFVTVLEVNQAPVLSPIADRVTTPSQSLVIQAVATDGDLPVQSLRYSLLPGAPSGATIDSATGLFRWDVPSNQASGNYPVSIRVSDGDRPELTDTESFNITVGCAVDSRLSGWSSFESGGTSTGKGSIAINGCAATMREGNSFLVGVQQSFQVPATARAVQFTYSDLSFDTDDPNFINDSFEVAIVDRDGNPLAAAFAPGRDAYWNTTEGMGSAAASQVVVANNTVTVGLGTVPAGTDARIIFRLVNDDDDTDSTVTIAQVKLVDAAGLSVAPGSPVAAPSTSFSNLANWRPPSLQDPLSVDGLVSTNSSSSGNTSGNIFPQADPDSVFVNFDDFSDVSALVLNGAAAVQNSADGAVLRLTPALAFQAGSAFSEEQVNARDFSTYFTFRISNRGGTISDCNTVAGADGLVFVVQSVSSSIGGIGAGIGYAGINQSIGVEFDTWCNAGNNDPSSNHVAIVTNGNVDHGAGAPFTKNIDPDFDNGQLWYAWVDYDGETLELRVSQDAARPATPTLARELDIPQIIQSDTAFVGFTSGTGADWGDHDLVSWQYNAEFSPIGDSIVTISASTADATVPAGSAALISGIALSAYQDSRATLPPPQITHVTINGVPVEVLSTDGNYFTNQLIQPGLNRFTLVAYDELGKSATTTLTIEGRTSSASIDFSRYADITGSFSGAYFRTSFHDATELLHVDLATRNDGQFESNVPLLVGVKNISDPSITLVGFNGFTPDGIPYYDYSPFVSGGRLQPGQLTAAPALLFHNPQRVTFDYELVFYGRLNAAPYFTSLPRVEALAGRDYRYDADASDSDGDPLSYKLLVAPVGMSIASNTGAITWTPTLQQVGRHDVAIEVSDGRGGLAQQRYTITAIEPPPNRPPVITSTPLTHVWATPFQPTEPIAYQSQWKYRVGDFGEFSGFEAVDYDDSTFSVGEGGFGSGGGCFLNTTARKTLWPTNSDIVMRKEIILDGNATNLRIFGAIDNDIQVFVNGVDISQGVLVREGCAELNEFSIVAPDALLRDGRNVVAVRARDRGSESYVDVRVTADVPASDSSRQSQRDFIYSYDVNAFDPDDDTLTYSLVTGPQGLQINGTTGMLHWIPSVDQIGDHAVQVNVSDGRGGLATQEFIIRVYPDPANNPPTIISQPPLDLILAGQSNPAQGDVNPSEIFVSNISNELFQQTISLTLPTSGIDLGTADILFVVDESGSMAGEQAWLTSIITTLDQSLNNAGVTNNRYGLVGFANTGRILQAGGDRWMTVQNFQTASRSLSTSRSGSEDGYDGIFFAMSNYTFRPSASRVMVLVTDEDRTTVNSSRNFTNTAALLTDQNIIFSIVANANMEDGNGTAAYGVESDGVSYVEDAQSGFATTQGGTFVRSETVSGGSIARIKEHYVDLAWQVGGVTWDLNFLRDTPAAATAFTNVFTQVLGDTIIRDIPINVIASKNDVGFVNQSGIQTNVPPGETVDFNIQFSQKDAARFDILFVNANTGDVLGSIPVNVANTFRYPAAAIDPDSDPLTFKLLSGPAGSTITSGGLLQWGATDGQVGDYPFSIRVDDGRGGSDTQQFTLNVRSPGAGKIQGTVFHDVNGDSVYEPNDEPALSNQVVYLDQNFNGVRDPGERFVVTIANGSYTIGNLPAGDYQLSVDAARPYLEGGSDSRQSVVLAAGEGRTGVLLGLSQVTQGSRNQSPIITSTPPTNALVFEPIVYNVVASDPDNDPIAYQLLTAPAGMTIHPTRGVLVWLPREAQVGDHPVVIRVSDDRGEVALQFFTITVALPNTAPTITSSAIDRVAAGQTLIQTLLAQDADQDPLRFSLAGEPAGMSIETIELRDPVGQVIETIQQLRWQVPQTAVGSTIPFTLTVSDGRGGEDTQAWSLQVLDASAANSAPTFVSTPSSVARVGRAWSYLARATDPDHDAITYSLTQFPSGMTIASSGLVTWTPAADAPSTVSVSVLARDDRGAEATQTFSLRVTTSEQNSAPAITSIPPNRGVVGQLVDYDPVAVDADGDALRWSLTLAPRGMSIDPDTGALRWTPDALQIGTHTVAVTVTDPLLSQFTQRFQLDVDYTNLAPAILSVPPTTAITTRTYIYAARAIDPERATLAWSLLTRPDGMTIDAATGVVSWVPATAQVGSHSVVIEVSDGLSSSRQRYTVVVSSFDVQSANRAPLITSTPIFSTEAGGLYQYQVVAVDPDGDALTYQWTSRPAGMEISSTGLITWSPALNDVGDYLIGFTATDARGAVAAQGYLLSVTQNQPPVITSTPVTSVVAGANYRYTVRASDPDNDPITYRLIEAPAGMSIDSRGRIVWNSPVGLTAAQTVTLAVSDNRGKSVTQTYSVTMLADTEAPRVSLSISTADMAFGTAAQLDLQAIYTIQIAASDNVGVATIGLLVDGKAVTLSSSSSITLTAEQLGVVELVAFATDATGLRGEATGRVTIGTPGQVHTTQPDESNLPPRPDADPSDTGQPVVTITSPEAGTTISNRVAIIGTVDDPEDNLWYYRAYYSRADRVSITNINLADPDWTVFHQSTQEVVEGELAVFDASNLTNDPYAIIVAGFDSNGRGYAAATLVYIEGNVVVGSFRLEFTDLSIPVVGIPIQVNRVYDTLNAPDEGDFGYGWTLGIQDGRIFEAGAIGPGGALNGGNDKFVPDKTKVYLTNPSGQRVGFTYKEVYQGGCSPILGCIFGALYTPSLVADPGVYDTLTIDETQVSRGGILGAFSQGINPEYYTLTTKEGLKYRYHETRGLESVTDRNGNVLTYSDSGIKHSTGPEIQFVRDHRGRIKEIIAPDGRKLVYEYNAAGDLIKLTDQEGLTTRYEYLARPAHYLDKAFDSLGNRSLTAEYDADNRFVGIFDAAGNQVDKREYDTDNNRGIVRDGNGNATTIIYDDRGNVLEEIDPLGNKTIRRYEDPRNPDRETTIIDGRGMVTERSYDARGNALAITERGPLASPLNAPIVTKFTYDARNNLTSITDSVSGKTVFEYDARGHITKTTNALGQSSTFTFDAKGQRSSFTDFNGHMTTFEYDAGCPCGSPSKVTNADGTFQSFEYNQFGQVTLEQTFEADGRLVERKLMEYDSLGRVTREVVGGGNDAAHPPTDVHRFYNGQLLEWEIIVNPASLAADGRLLESPATPVAERKSRITEYRYDNRNNLITQIDAMGGVVQFRYDAQGNRVLLRDPVGNITTWTYDALNRVAEDRDSFYWVDYVTANATLNTNALLTAVVEENNKPSSASLPANQGAPHVRSFAYDAAGNQSKIIDRNNRRREFTYDYAGRVLEERWYNAVDHVTAPAALVETVSFTYDAMGNVLTASDSNSRYQHTYDALNRLIIVDNNPLGDRQNPRVVLTNGYDAQGNLTLTSDDAGVTVSSNYDARGRLATRRWFDANVPAGEEPDVANARVDFSYTAAGREREVRRYADLSGTNLVSRTLRTYDLVGRSNSLNHLNAVDQILTGYDYDYDFGGLLVNEQRSHQKSEHSQSIQYRYDLTGQLIEALFSGQDDEAYQYDLNGNRTSSSGGLQRTYTTGAANQLQSDGVYDYSYDGEGNQIKRISRATGETRSMRYDHRNRLIEVEDWSADPERDANAISISRAKLTYDALDELIMELHINENAQATKLASVYTGRSKWQEVNETAQSTQYFLTNDMIDVRLASSQAQSTEWIYADKLGTTRATQVSSDGPLLSYSYSAFGTLLAGSDASGVPGHSGRPLGGIDDAVYDFRSRFYDSASGNFLSRDTIGFEGADSNLYRFVFNSPVNLVDPLGTMAGEYARISATTARVAKILADCVSDIVLGAAIEATIYFILIDGVPYVGKTQREVAQRVAEHRRKFQAAVVEVLQKVTVPRANVRAYEQFAMDTFDRVVGVGRKNSIRAVSIFKYASPC